MSTDVVVLGTADVSEVSHVNDARTLLSTAARTAAPTIADETGLYGPAVTLYLDITASPNNAETLTVSIQGKDPVTGKYVTLAAFTAITASAIGATPTTATFAFILDPSQVDAALTAGTGGRQIKQGRLPRTWRTQIAHSSTGSWTYTLGASAGIN